MADMIRLASGDTTAEIARRGAELRRLICNGNEVLWTPDAGIWDGTAQILFPVIGRVENDAIRVGAETFPMPMHGFAKDMEFALTSHSATSCTLELASCGATASHYPFAFNLQLTYSVSNDGLHLRAEITNRGADPMPASFGFHPGFRWPLRTSLKKDRHRLVFPGDDSLTYVRPQNRQLGPERHRLPLEDGVLRLHEELFEQSGLVFLSPKSRSLRFEAEDGTASVDLDYPRFRQLILWMRPGSDFLCIEPCSGYSDAIGFSGEFSEKPGNTIIEPAQALRLCVRITARFQ